VHRKRGDLLRKHLKPDAVPHIWSEWPAYCSKRLPVQRSPHTTAEQRKEKEVEVKQRKLSEELQSDKVFSLADIRSKLRIASTLPLNISVIDSAEKLLYMAIDTDKVIPEIKYCVTIDKNLAL
jgi:hypothetical protein